MFCNVYYEGNVSDKGSLSTTRPPFRLVSHLGLQLGVQIVLFILFVVYYISSPNAFTTTFRVRKAREQFRWHIAMAGRPRGRPPKKYTPRGRLAAKLRRSITELFSHSSPEPPSEGEATAPNPPSRLEDDTIRRNKPEWKNLGRVNTVDISHWFDAQHNDFNSWKAHFIVRWTEPSPLSLPAREEAISRKRVVLRWVSLRILLPPIQIARFKSLHCIPDKSIELFPIDIIRDDQMPAGGQAEAPTTIDTVHNQPERQLSESDSPAAVAFEKTKKLKSSTRKASGFGWSGLGRQEPASG
ncbi:hypothetical protein K439DRAFT_1619755 [Ramaria rubella]|nr:hypothetical protein K439DRAFT_1619755 [Ramaria rubella]